WVQCSVAFFALVGCGDNQEVIARSDTPDSGPGILADAGPTCPNGATTTLTGTAFAPNGTTPLYNALVFVPKGPLPPMPTTLTCDQCSGGARAPAVVAART